MPLYNTATAAAALGVTPKWFDNLLSHNKIGGVVAARQGVARRLPLSTIEFVAVVRDLTSALGIPVSAAIDVAHQLLHEPGRPCIISPAISMSLDTSALRHEVASRLAHAVEIAPQRPRGRPPKRTP